MNEEEQNELQKRLKELLKEFSNLTVGNLEQTRKMLNNEVANLIELYSNHIRNLGIISGVVAPFSLSLLAVERIDVNAGILIFGFALLIIDIILSQIFLSQQLLARDRRISKAELEWITASVSKSMIEDEALDISQRTFQTYEYNKSTSALHKLLGLELLTVEPQEVKRDLRSHTRLLYMIFSIGCALIIFSTLINPALDIIVKRLF